MLLGIIWTAMTVFSVLFGINNGAAAEVGNAALEGAQAAIEFVLEIGGVICLWCAVMELMKQAGIISQIEKLLKPLLRKIFPNAAKDDSILEPLSMNVAANFLGLGNAATPLGMSAAATDTPEAFMELLEGKLKDRFHAAPVVRVHWWLFGTRPPQDRFYGWLKAFEDGELRLKALLRHVFASPEYLAGPVRGGFPARRMDAEVLEDALCDLTGAQHDFQSIAPEPFTYLPKSRRAVLIEDGSITSPFLLLFGRPARDSGDMAERNNAITAKQRLQLFNSAKLWRDLGQFGQDPRFRGLNRREKIEDLYLRFLARPPTPAEMRLLNGKNELGPREIAWMLVNSREFLYRI